jgi:hypothetical protein
MRLHNSTGVLCYAPILLKGAAFDRPFRPHALQETGFNKAGKGMSYLQKEAPEHTRRFAAMKAP